MKVTLHDPGPFGLAAWTELARPLLEADPVRHTIALTVVDDVAHGAGSLALLLSVRDDAVGLLGVAQRSPGWGMLVSALPPACAPAVVAALAGDEHVELWRRGISGSLAEVDALAVARCAATGERAVVDIDLRSWELDTLSPPSGVPGGPRAATAADVGLLAGWYRAFAADIAADHPGRDHAAEPHPGADPHAGADPHTADPHSAGREPADDPDLDGPAAEAARDVALGRDLVLWEVDGRPVALAAARLPVAGSVRIGPVYTPPAERGHGYGSAVTAAAAARALATGARRIVLFTDADADVPNRIYARIGFVRRGDAREIRFVDE